MSVEIGVTVTEGFDLPLFKARDVTNEIEKIRLSYLGTATDNIDVVMDKMKQDIQKVLDLAYDKGIFEKPYYVSIHGSGNGLSVSIGEV